MTNKIKNTAPAWHKDVKWLFGILALIALHITLLGINVYRLTEEKIAIRLTATALASSFSPDGLDDPKSLAEVNQLLKYQNSISPIPGLNLKITKEDFAGKSPREARIGFFEKLATPLYREGQEGVAKLATDPKIKNDIKSGTSFLTIVSQKNHDFIGGIIKITSLICLLLLAGVIFFSQRFGRLFAPGLIITLVSLPGALLSFLLTTALRLHPAATTVAREAGIGDKVGAVWQVVGPDIVAVLAKTYQTALAVGLMFIGLALAGRIIHAIIRKKSKKTV